MKRVVRQRMIGGALVLLGLGLFTIGAISLIDRYLVVYKKPSPISRNVTSRSTTTPDEARPDCENYSTHASLPRKIELPTIDAEGCVVQVGIDQSNAIAVPGNIHLAGWYTNSPLPGEKGVSIIDGHVSGKYVDGIFKRLKDLREGDVFQLQYGDKSIKKFKVLTTGSYSVEETTKKMYLQNPGVERQLNLITCGGPFDNTSQQYQKRILITSTLLQ